jgi:hypothetical protein
MPQVGFEPSIAVFERAKTIHALDSAAIVIGIVLLCRLDTTDHYNQPIKSAIINYYKLLFVLCVGSVDKADMS